MPRTEARLAAVLPPRAARGVARALLPAALLLAAALLLSAPLARAESAFRLALPDSYGRIEAATFDAAGNRIGAADMSVVRRDDGRIELHARSGIDDDVRSDAVALLAPSEDEGGLRLLSERTEVVERGGASMGVLSIDHEARVARCAPAGGELELPPEDRVVNVPLNLLFQRLATGEEREVSFQVMLCRFGARLVDARARVASPPAAQGGLVEVRYQLDFGPLLTTLAEPFLPTLSFWFDPSAPGAWVGHRMPLFSKGPTVFVVRSGVAPERLAPEVGAGPGL
jgi:hypothetical protein